MTLSALILTFTFNASANSELLITQLESESIDTRSIASQRIYGAGIGDSAVYDKLESILLKVGKDIPKRSDRSDEVAWHLKALSSSGDLKYIATMEMFLKSKNRKVAKYAKKSIKELRDNAIIGGPALHYDKVRLISGSQVEKCTYLGQQTCKTSRSSEKCVIQHKSRAISHGGNAVMILHSDTNTARGLVPWDKATNMMASYYLCDF